jgi:transposase InsO family protein
VSRAGFYRTWEESEPRRAETELRDRIQKLSLAYPQHGSRRIAKLLSAEGQAVNRKRVQRLMREDNLLVLRKRRYVVTTDARHTYAVYPNLAGGIEATAANQLWVADITYVRLRESFIYLAVILDAWSRRVVGWSLAETLTADLALAALEMALKDRAVTPGIVHHSDRGVQYCSQRYTDKLRDYQFQISMSRAGNPYDNALAESFMRTLKCEEVYLAEYRDAEDAHQRISRFLDDYYNRRRLHSSLGYRTPEAYERKAADGQAPEKGETAP